MRACVLSGRAVIRAENCELPSKSERRAVTAPTDLVVARLQRAPAGLPRRGGAAARGERVSRAPPLRERAGRADAAGPAPVPERRAPNEEFTDRQAVIAEREVPDIRSRERIEPSQT